MEMEEADVVEEEVGEGRERMRILVLDFAMMRLEVAEMQQSNREEEAKPKEEEGSTEAKRGAKKKCKEGLITCCCGSQQ
jgi:hypothetical protein